MSQPSTSTAASVTVTVRFFAAARAAAGRDEETITLTGSGQLRTLIDALSAQFGAGLSRVLAGSSYLVDEVTATADQPLRDGAQIDVLPPFAGG